MPVTAAPPASMPVVVCRVDEVFQTSCMAPLIGVATTPYRALPRLPNTELPCPAAPPGGSPLPPPAPPASSLLEPALSPVPGLMAPEEEVVEEAEERLILRDTEEEKPDTEASAPPET